MHCIKCGADNPDDAEFCNKCGSRVDTKGVHEPYKRAKDECFGLPHGSSIFALFIGLIIIIWGITQVLKIEIDWWPFIVILFGILVIAGAVYGLARRRR